MYASSVANADCSFQLVSVEKLQAGESINYLNTKHIKSFDEKSHFLYVNEKDVSGMVKMLCCMSCRGLATIHSLSKLSECFVLLVLNNLEFYRLDPK